MRKPASQGSRLASKGAYIDVSDRRMQVLLTPEAKIASDFYFIRAIFAVVGFVSALTSLPRGARMRHSPSPNPSFCIGGRHTRAIPASMLENCSPQRPAASDKKRAKASFFQSKRKNRRGQNAERSCLQRKQQYRQICILRRTIAKTPSIHAPPSPKTAAGGRPLRVGLPPSIPTTAPTGTKRRAPAPCSWGGRSSIPSQRLLAAGTAGPA